MTALAMNSVALQAVSYARYANRAAQGFDRTAKAFGISGEIAAGFRALAERERAHRDYMMNKARRICRMGQIFAYVSMSTLIAGSAAVLAVIVST